MQHRHGQRVDQADVNAHLPRHHGDLGADQPGADDGQAPGTGQLGTDRHRLIEGAQDVDARQVMPGGQPPRRDPGGDDQPVERQLRTISEPDTTVQHVQADRADPESPLGREPLHCLGLAQEGSLGLPAAVQDLLGKRRPVVRRVVLLTHHDQLASVVNATQRLCGCQAAADAPTTTTESIVLIGPVKVSPRRSSRR